MSKTTLMKVTKDGTVEQFKEYRNAFGFGPFIWTALCDCYLNGMSWVTAGPDLQRLWDLANDDRLANAEKIALVATFDYAMVKREDIGLVSHAFFWFVKEHQPQNVVCSLMDQVRDLTTLAQDEDCAGAAWWGTSVSQDPWAVRYLEDDSRRYNINRDEGHWFLPSQAELLLESGNQVP